MRVDATLPDQRVPRPTPRGVPEPHDRARSRPTSRSSARRIRTGSAICIATTDGASTRPATRASPSRSSRSRSRSSTASRSRTAASTACWTEVGVEPTGDAFNSISLDEPVEPPAEPDDQRGRDRRRPAWSRAGHVRRRASACSRCSRSTPATRLDDRRRRVPLGEGDRAPQSRRSATCCGTSTS